MLTFIVSGEAEVKILKKKALSVIAEFRNDDVGNIILLEYRVSAYAIADTDAELPIPHGDAIALAGRGNGWGFRRGCLCGQSDR